MSLRTSVWVAMGLWLLPSVARAQVPEDVENEGEAAGSVVGGGFYADAESDGSEADYGGSLAWSTFVFKEVGGDLNGGGVGGIDADLDGDGMIDEQVPIPAASPILRLYTDLRGQLHANRFAGDAWNARADFRVRVTGDELGIGGKNDAGDPDNVFDGQGDRYGYDVQGQSGAFGGAEIELRELYVVHDGERWDFGFGRQHALDLAATRFDGARIVYHPSSTWRVMAFAGLYPSRVSRSLEDDYPRAAPALADDTDAMTPGIQAPPKSRIFPITGGAGVGYDRDKMHGAVGVVAVAPLADDYQENVMGTAETPRVLITTNGYYRPSDKIDLFHYVIVDVAGAAGARLSNGSLMAAFSPTTDWRITAMVNHVDTVTLNVLAQTRLEDEVPPSTDMMGNPVDGALLQNNAVVSRVAQDEARLSISRALSEKRFELSVIGALRRRPEIELTLVGGDPFVVPAAQAVDATVRFVDRQSFWDSRLVASATAILGVGAENLNRSNAVVGRVALLRDVADGKGEVDFHLTYIHSRGADRGEGSACNQDMLTGCYSSVLAHTGQLGATMFYRLADAWFVLAGASFGVQKLKTVYDVTAPTARPPIFMVTGFSRLAYRF